MKKLILLLLMCGAAARADQVDSLSLLDKETYKISNIKKLFNWGIRAGFQCGKMYTGKRLFCRGNGLIIHNDNWQKRGLCSRTCHYAGGGALFLHGLQGLLKECGYESPGALLNYLEGKSA